MDRPLSRAEMLIMAQRMRMLGPLMEAHDPFRYKGMGKAADLPVIPEGRILEDYPDYDPKQIKPITGGT